MDKLARRSFGVLSALVLATLALSHHLVYVLADHAGGAYSRAMSEAGHDRYWTAFLVVVGVVTVVLTIVAIRQLQRLGSLAAAARVGDIDVGDAGVDRLVRIVVPLWLRLFLLTTAAFLLQENLETLSVGRTMPGLGAVGGAHWVALPTIAVVAFAVSVVRGLMRWRRDVLLARLRARHPVFRRETQRYEVIDLGHRGSCADPDRNGVRAPPAWNAVPA